MLNSYDDYYNRAFGQWYVPCYLSGPGTAITWVGIGGSNAAQKLKLWQAGTETDPQQGYRMWYEDWPDQSIIYAGPAVNCGDNVWVYLDYNYTFAGDSYVDLENQSSGQYYATTKYFHPDEQSAEWIDERICSGSFTPLADFQHTQWTDAEAADGWLNGDNEIGLGTWWSTYPSDVCNISMLQNSTWLAYPDGSPTANGFTDRLYNHGTTGPSC